MGVWLCVGVLVIFFTCIHCVFYRLYCVFVLFCLCIFILVCFACTSARLLPLSDNLIAVSSSSISSSSSSSSNSSSSKHVVNFLHVLVLFGHL